MKVVCEHTGCDVIHDKWEKCELCEAHEDIVAAQEMIASLKGMYDASEQIVTELEERIADLEEQLKSIQRVGVDWNREGF
jgi:bacterioferritin (cytochrome b1)